MASEFRKLQSPMQQRKQHSQISGLLVASMSNNQISDDQDDVTGKKRKHFQTTIKTEWESPSLFQHTYKNNTADGRISLQIIKQPERQHRARYQTEGSRGAIKDRSQNMFPSVQLKGYAGINGIMGNFPQSKPPVLQVFIGNDQGDPIPHIYYQACKVAGKNSTPCQEKKKEGTDVILIDMDPTRFYEVNCDCVGILKERASDIENKKPHQTRRTNWRKKTTKCRMVFRTEIENLNGDMEVLQVVSDPISCTQLPGTPEIAKMSLSTCYASGGEELWMIGKNFLKDCVVVFQESACSRQLPDRVWSKSVDPLKDYFHSTHLIVIVPPYGDSNVKEAVRVNVTVKCGGKESDNFVLTYLPTKSNFSVAKTLGPTINSVKGGLFSSKQRGQSDGGNGSIEGPKFISNGTLDDYSPAQSLNKISASMRGTRSTTNNFNTSAAANSNSMISAGPSIAHSSNSSNLTIKSSKMVRRLSTPILKAVPVSDMFAINESSVNIIATNTSYNKSRITILEQLDCSSSGSAARKTRGSKRSKDNKYRSSLPRKVEQPDIFSDDTLFDTVDATNMSKNSSHMSSKSFRPLANEQIVASQPNQTDSRVVLTATVTGSPEKKNKNGPITDTSALYSLLQSSFPATSSSNNQNQRQQELLQNLSAPSPASVTNYREFSEDSTSIVSHDDTTTHDDEGSNDSSRMSAASVSTVKDDTLVSSIAEAAPFSNTTQEAVNVSKSHIPLSFLGITKQHKHISGAPQHSLLNGNQVSSTTQEPKFCKEERNNIKEDSCLIEAMESHSALISTPTNEATGTVYSFSPSQFGGGGLCDQGLINIKASPNIGHVPNNILCQQEKVVTASEILQHQQQITQNTNKQMQVQYQEQQQQPIGVNMNLDTSIQNSTKSTPALGTMMNKSEMDTTKPPMVIDNSCFNTHQTPTIQDQLQQQQAMAQGEKCKYSIANAESECASISIKLPPSILSNQDRLETIVNTINKAITTPPTAAQQKDSQQAAEMIASININNNQQQQQQQQQQSQQQFNQNIIHSQPSSQQSNFQQTKSTMPTETNTSVLTDNVTCSNNLANYGHQTLTIDPPACQDWNFEQDGAEAKKIKVSPSEKEICDAAAVNATNAINSVPSVNTCPSNPVPQNLVKQCFSETDTQPTPPSSNNWTTNTQSTQAFTASPMNPQHCTAFATTKVWQEDVKDHKKIQIIEDVSGQPAPIIPNQGGNWTNANTVSQVTNEISDTTTNATSKALDAAAVAANVTNAINAAAASLNNSILDAQAATNALNAAAAAASLTNNLNAALAVANVTGNVEHTWSQAGGTTGISNPIQTSQHNYNPVEAQASFSQASGIWAGQQKQVSSQESREQGAVWAGNVLQQQQQGSFDSVTGGVEYGSVNSSPNPNWSAKGVDSIEQSNERVKPSSNVPTSGVWPGTDNVNAGFVTGSKQSNEYTNAPVSSWTNDTLEQNTVEHVQRNEGRNSNVTNTNSPSNITTWKAADSPDSYVKVQNTQGTFSPAVNWTDGLQDNHKSPVAATSLTNASFNKSENQQHFSPPAQIWNNQQEDIKEDKSSGNINSDSQMWDLTRNSGNLPAQNVSKNSNSLINPVTEMQQQNQKMQSNMTDIVVNNTSDNLQQWENSVQRANIKATKQDLIVGEEWNSPITNDPMLSETSAGVIQQQQKAEEKWPAFNAKTKTENQWNTTTENTVTQQATPDADWSKSFSQQSNNESRKDGSPNWATQFSGSTKVENSTLQHAVESPAMQQQQQQQQKQQSENWSNFNDQKNKWPAQNQEIPDTVTKLATRNVEAGKTINWPTFNETCKTTEKWPASNDNIQQNQNEGNWNTFKIQSEKETVEWKVVPNQSLTTNIAPQHHQEPPQQNNVWSPSTQQQQVPQDGKWIQDANVSQQTVSSNNETWASALSVEGKQSEQNSTRGTNNSWPESLANNEDRQSVQNWGLSTQQHVQSHNVENKQSEQNQTRVANTNWSESLSTNEDRQSVQNWGLSTQPQVQSLPIGVPGMAGNVRSVLENETHRVTISSSEMLAIDPKDTALPVDTSSSFKDATPMEVDTGSYDNPLLTPNPQIQ